MTSDTTNTFQLPESVEAKLYELWFQAEDSDRGAAVDAFCERHPQLAPAIRERWARLARSDQLVGAIGRAVNADATPSRVGPYRVIEQVGQGGFGVVYLAEQDEPIRRTVALKLLLADTTSARAVERFHAERNVLAMMSHTSIAHVLDAGYDAGRPYFVMEYVDGSPITDYCDRHRLGIEERLRLFVRVCAGVHHAHQKGILHRDLKPTNILVVTEDGMPVPKIIDFGIAKALHGEVSVVPLQTEDGRIVGTPEYMSPEQASGQPVDTRADIYALGVLLFELLTGQLPFESTELRGGDVLRTARVIREREPLRPSEALMRHPERAGIAALGRGLEIGALLARLRNDLDWVLDKALQKDREARYGSVSELAAEVERVLRDEPVLARRPELSYVFRKFVRRHAVGVAVAAVLATLLIVGSFGATWGIVQIESARADAVRQREHAEANAYAANIAAAKSALDDGDASGARRRLEECVPSLRGWEWYHLHGRCDDSLEVLDVGGMTRDLLVTNADRTLVSFAYDGAVTWWDLGTRRALRSLPADDIWHVAALRPDGSTIAIASSDGWIRLRDARSGQPMGTPWHGAEPVQSIAFAPDGWLIAFGSGDGVIRVVDLRTASVHDFERVHERGVFSLDYDPSGQLLASGGLDSMVVVWDTSTRRPIHRFRDHEDHVRCVRFGPAGRLLASASRDGTIRLWEPRSGERLRRIDCRTGLWDVVFQPDGETLAAVGGYAGRSFVGLYRASTGEPIGTHVGHEGAVWSAAYSSDGGRFFTGSRDGTIRVWPARPASHPRKLESGRWTRSVACMGDDVVTGSLRGSLVRWDVPADRPVWRTPRAAGVGTMACDTVAERLFVVGYPEDDRLEVYDAKDGRATGAERALDVHVASLSYGPAVDLVAIGSVDGAAILVDPGTLVTVRDLPGHDGAVRVCFDPAGSELATGDESGTFRLWDAASGALRTSVVLSDAPVTSIAFHAGGRLLAAASDDGTIRLVDSRDATVTAVLAGHESAVFGLAFSPDATRLASAGLDNTVRVWETDRGTELVVFTDPRSDAQSVVFADHGRRLFAGADDLYEWSIRDDSGVPTGSGH